MEVEWDALRQEENKSLSLDSLQYNPFALAAQVILVKTKCCWSRSCHL